jgi:uncharacterized protein YndB with AHSA1/START domain
MLTYILLGLAAVVLLLVIVVAFQAADFRVTRSATIAAPPESVFAHVNDFHKWEAWSPWAKLDPNCKYSYEGPDSGEGAKFSWEGNKEVGEGKMTILESKPGELVKIKLEFLKPFKATNTAEFTFKPEGDNTNVTWSMYGKNNFMGKAFHLIIDCDKMVGKDFEKGLASMKSVVESSAEASLAAH